MSPRTDYRIARSSGLRILYIAYPLLTVSDASAGGAEQMLWTLEHEIARCGVHTTVAASAGSQVSGELFVTGDPSAAPDDFERRNREHQERILRWIDARDRQGKPFELIHDKSGSFWPRASEINLPVLATLHLPRHFYPSQFFEHVHENVSFNCVSRSQADSFADLNAPVVNNGILLDRFNTNTGPRNGLLWLGRICEEKAPHLALEISAQAKQPITLAGQVYPFSYHQQYFEREVAPRLERMRGADLITTPSAEQKRRLLREAKALLITSTVDETSSLVAMEAAASGTPVIAFRRGAVPEIVQDGITGWLAEDVREAVHAVGQIEQISSSECLAHAQINFSSVKMAEAYHRLYCSIVAKLGLTGVGVTGWS